MSAWIAAEDGAFDDPLEDVEADAVAESETVDKVSVDAIENPLGDVEADAVEESEGVDKVLVYVFEDPLEDVEADAVVSALGKEAEEFPFATPLSIAAAALLDPEELP